MPRHLRRQHGETGTPDIPGLLRSWLVRHTPRGTHHPEIANDPRHLLLSQLIRNNGDSVGRRRGVSAEEGAALGDLGCVECAVYAPDVTISRISELVGMDSLK